MNTITVSFESGGELSLPSGEISRQACGVKHRRTWKRIKEANGFGSESVLSERQLVWAVVCNRFLGLQNRKFATYEVFQKLRETTALDEFIHGFSDYGQPITYQQIVNQIRGNYQCLQDSQLKSKPQQKTQQNPPQIMQVVRMKQQQKPQMREPLLAL